MSKIKTLSKKKKEEVKIYQRFDFLPEEQKEDDKRIVKERGEKALSTLWKERNREFLSRLRNTGNIILVSSASFAGIPASVILCGEINRNIKSDFCTISGELRLCFKSKECYFKSRKGS